MGASINSINEATFEEWFLNTVDPETLVKIALTGSWDHEPFISYECSDTSILYERFEDEIWELVTKYAAVNDSHELLAISFDGGFGIRTPKQFKCAMVLIAATCVAVKSAISGYLL